MKRAVYYKCIDDRGEPQATFTVSPYSITSMQGTGSKSILTILQTQSKIPGKVQLSTEPTRQKVRP